ncbi:MAG: RluA family pseudouridine synthase [Myxococcota bacterium]
MRLEVDDVLAGSRLDRFLVARVPHMSRAKAKRFVVEGWVRVNGRHPKKGQSLALGDIVHLERLPDPPDFRAIPEDAPLEVLHEDESCVVVNKAPGIPTHPLRADELGTLANRLVHRYPEMAEVGYRRREPGVLHRLDTGTSGVLIAARTTEAFEVLRELLRGEQITKRYAALCDGLVHAPQRIDFPIAQRDARSMRVCRDVAEEERLGGQRAVTEILKAEPLGSCSLITAQADSARRHQLRVHLAAIGHPLLGDELYGGPPGLSRHALHASRLRVEAPWGTIDISAPLPSDMQALLR